MSIRYVPNDPLASAPPVRTKKPRTDRPSSRAGFTWHGAAPEGVHPVGTPEFLFWQSREAALAAVETHELIDGPLASWARATPNPRRIDLLPDDGLDLNAYYDGQSVAFFHYTTGSKTTVSGASTDVVAHEVGHAVLDALRPDLWSSFFTEVGAFHEAYGDCMAILTGFADAPTRQALLASSGGLDAANFLEATAEDLSDGVKRAAGASHPAAAPRRALNSFQWVLPSTLPSSGPPHVLTSEIHSFGRIMSGCLWDTIRNILAVIPGPAPAALRSAVTTAARLFVAGTKAAPESARFFQSVGRSMILADDQMSGGANHLAIKDAFAGHGIALGTAAMLAPTAPLPGAAPKVSKTTASLAAATAKELARRMGVPPAKKLLVRARDILGERVAEAVHKRAVDLGDVHKSLKGVVALATESVMVGSSGNRAAIVGSLTDSAATEDEVRTFVETLWKMGKIALAGAQKKKAAIVAGPKGKKRPRALPSHAVKVVSGKKTLVRVRFSCPAGR